MNSRIAISLFGALVASSAGWAQTSLFDRVLVDFQNNVNVNGKVIPAGHYEIRELRSSGAGSHILFVTANGGTTFEASGATIPILQNEPAAETKVILQRIGQNYYLNKIWISGKDYGYDFPLPAEAKALMQERAEPITLTASYRPEPVASAAATPPAPPAEPQTAPPPAPAPSPEPAPAPAATQTEPATPPPAATPTPTPNPPQAEPAPTPGPSPSPTMPATADDWATLLTAGAAIATLGLLLRRK